MKALQDLPFVLLAYQFGSSVKGTTRKKSDVDIAVLTGEPPHDSLQIKMDLLVVLQSQFSGEIDLTILNQAGSVLKYQVIKNGKLLYEREPGLHKKFFLKTLQEYFDFQPRLDFFYKKKVA